jgi:hypothetical protein
VHHRNSVDQACRHGRRRFDDRKHHGCIA